MSTLERADGEASAAAVRSLAAQVGVDPMLVAQHLKNGTASVLLNAPMSRRSKLQARRMLLDLLARKYPPA